MRTISIVGRRIGNIFVDIYDPNHRPNFVSHYSNDAIDPSSDCSIGEAFEATTFRVGSFGYDRLIRGMSWLPGLSTTASSSLSSGELLETPPRAPSSPSAASLQLKPEPLSAEMGGKSSSAPLLENNDAAKTNGKVPVSCQLGYTFSEISDPSGQLFSGKQVYGARSLSGRSKRRDRSARAYR